MPVGSEVIIRRQVLKEVTLLFHDTVELVNVDLTITITVSLIDHVLKLLLINVLTELLGYTTQIAKGDFAGVVIIEQFEHLLNVLTSVLLTHLSCHHLKELSELDGAVAVVVNV